MNNLHFSTRSGSTNSFLFNQQADDRLVRRDSDVQQLAQSLFIDSPIGPHQTDLHEGLLNPSYSPRQNIRSRRSTEVPRLQTPNFRILSAPNIRSTPNLLSLSQNYTLGALGKDVSLIKNPLKKGSSEPIEVVSQTEKERGNPISLVEIMPGEREYLSFEESCALRITDIENKDFSQTFDLSPYMQRVSSAACWKDCRVLALGTNNGVFLLDRRERPIMKQLAGSNLRNFPCLDLSGDQTYLSAGDTTGEVSIFDLRYTRCPLSGYTHTLGHECATEVNVMEWLPQNRYLLTGSCGEEGMLKVFDTALGRVILETPNPGIAELKLCGDHLFTTRSEENSNINMWSFDTERGLNFIQDLIPRPLIFGPFSSLAIEEDPTGLLMFGAANLPTSSLYFWNLETERRSVADPTSLDAVDFR